MPVKLLERALIGTQKGNNCIKTSKTRKSGQCQQYWFNNQSRCLNRSNPSYSKYISNDRKYFGVAEGGVEIGYLQCI